jgi:hypothetical protein
MFCSIIKHLQKTCSNDIATTSGLHTDEVHSLRILHFKHNNLYSYLEVLLRGSIYAATLSTTGEEDPLFWKFSTGEENQILAL